MSYKIGIDIDNVCVNTTWAVLEYINKRLSTNLRLGDITQYSIEAALPEQYRWIVDEAFHSAEMWKQVKFLPHAAEVIQDLWDDGYEIYFVTSTTPKNLHKKVKHLCRNLPFMFDEYISRHTINIQDKWLLKLDILIDDCLDNLLALGHERSYYSICIDYPWNETKVSIPNFTRVKDWTEVMDKVRMVESLTEEKGNGVVS